MKLLLDMHAFLWMPLDEPQLGETAREQLADAENDLHLSPAAYWEIAIRISVGKYTLAEPLVEFVGREIDRTICKFCQLGWNTPAPSAVCRSITKIRLIECLSLRRRSRVFR